MGPEQKLNPSQMSPRDREMMGLGTKLETEEPDDEGSYKPDPKAQEEYERKYGKTGALKPATTQSRFANLELVPPGLEGEELEKWEKEHEQMVKEADERRKEKERQEELNKPYSSKYF